jgi:hypothetical protein
MQIYAWLEISQCLVFQIHIYIVTKTRPLNLVLNISGIGGPGRTAVEPALRRYLREWRLRDPEEVRQRLSAVLALPLLT